ncbi:MAG: hypothetical protein ABSE05_15855, partial [Syntrophales bacterium]
ESSALLNAVSVHQVIPRLKPGGRKILSNGLEDRGSCLLFRQDTTGFTKRKRPLIISSLIFQYTRKYAPRNCWMLYQEGSRKLHVLPHKIVMLSRLLLSNILHINQIPSISNYQ